MESSCETSEFEDLQSKFNNCIEIFKNNNKIFLQFREDLDAYLNEIIKKTTKIEPETLIKLSETSNFLGISEKTVIKFANEGKIYTQKDSNNNCSLYDPFSYLNSLKHYNGQVKYKEIVAYCRVLPSDECWMKFLKKQTLFVANNFKKFSVLSSCGQMREDKVYIDLFDKAISKKISTIVFIDTSVISQRKDELEVVSNFFKRFNVEILNLDIKNEMYEHYKKRDNFTMSDLKKSYTDDKKMMINNIKKVPDTDNISYINSEKACKVLGITSAELNTKKEQGAIYWYSDCRILNFCVDNKACSNPEDNVKKCIAYYEKLRENDVTDYTSIFDNIIKNEYIIYTDRRNVTNKFNLNKILKQVSLNLVSKLYILRNRENSMSSDFRDFIHLVAIKFNCEVKFLLI